MTNQVPETTITRSMPELWAETGNVYESVRIIAKRANQISTQMKNEINEKLQEVASYQDAMEEPTENSEQVEISKYYEQLPKATLIATTEFLNGEIYFRSPAASVKNED